MNKKRFLTLLLAGALSLGLTACSGGDERGSSSTGDQSSSSTAEEPSSGTENSSKVEGFTLDTPPQPMKQRSISNRRCLPEMWTRSRR